MIISINTECNKATEPSVNRFFFFSFRYAFSPSCFSDEKITLFIYLALYADYMQGWVSWSSVYLESINLLAQDLTNSSQSSFWNRPLLSSFLLLSVTLARSAVSCLSRKTWSPVKRSIRNINYKIKRSVQQKSIHIKMELIQMQREEKETKESSDLTFKLNIL